MNGLWLCLCVSVSVCTEEFVKCPCSLSMVSESVLHIGWSCSDCPGVFNVLTFVFLLWWKIRLMLKVVFTHAFHSSASYRSSQNSLPFENGHPKAVSFRGGDLTEWTIFFFKTHLQLGTCLWTIDAWTFHTDPQICETLLCRSNADPFHMQQLFSLSVHELHCAYMKIKCNLHTSDFFMTNLHSSQGLRN